MPVKLSHRLLSNNLILSLMRNVPLFSSKRSLSFDLTEQQKKLKNKTKQFSKQTILPKAVEYDTKMEFPSKIIKQVHSRGLMNSLVPVEYGGLGYDILSRVLISEALAYGCTGLGVTILGNDLAATPLLLGGREDQKKKYLGQLTSEPVLASYCVSTPNGSNGKGLELAAVHKGNEWILNGSKIALNGGNASWFVVLARTDPEAPNEKAFTAFIVDGDVKGLSRGDKKINGGQRCSTACTINLEDVVVHSSNIISLPGEGFNVAMKTFENTRPVFAALSIGLTTCVLDEVVKSMRAIPLPVSNDQLHQFVIADLVLKNELSSIINYKVSQEFDRCAYTAYWASLARSISFDTANEALNWLNVWKNFLNGSDLDNKLQIEKLSRDLKLFDQSHYVKMIEPSTIASKSENSGFGINFPFRRLNLITCDDDINLLAGMFEKKIYDDAKELLDKAKNYYVFGYYVDASEKAWEAYVCTLKYFYKDVNSIFIGSNGGIGALSIFASKFYKGPKYDFITAYALANCAHVNGYNGGASAEEVWDWIQEIEKFMEKFKLIDKEEVKKNLAEILPTEPLKKKKYGNDHFILLDKPTKFSIFGREFEFLYTFGVKLEELDDSRKK